MIHRPWFAPPLRDAPVCTAPFQRIIRTPSKHRTLCQVPPSTERRCNITEAELLRKCNSECNDNHILRDTSVCSCTGQMGSEGWRYR